LMFNYHCGLPSSTSRSLMARFFIGRWFWVLLRFSKPIDLFVFTTTVSRTRKYWYTSFVPLGQAPKYLSSQHNLFFIK
jgi:hypothetical protein